MISAKFNTTLNRLTEQWVTVHRGNEPTEEEEGRGAIEIDRDRKRGKENSSHKQQLIRAKRAPRTSLITPLLTKKKTPPPVFREEKDDKTMGKQPSGEGKQLLHGD